MRAMGGRIDCSVLLVAAGVVVVVVVGEMFGGGVFLRSAGVVVVVVVVGVFGSRQLEWMVAGRVVVTVVSSLLLVVSYSVVTFPYLYVALVLGEGFFVVFVVAVSFGLV